MTLNSSMLEFLLEYRISGFLRKKNLKLAIVESCTGGLIGHRVTNIPGSSDYYLGSVVAYANETKERLLGLQHETLVNYGAVSRETALEMARCIRQILSADFDLEHVIGLSTTGIAGPGGGQPNRPVGLVWIGLSTPDGDHALQFVTHGNRLENKAAFAEQALGFLISYLDGTLPSES